MKVGIIAGTGDLPVVLAHAVKRSGKQLAIISIIKDVNEQLRSLTPHFFQFGVGQVKKIIDSLLKLDALETVIIGSVPKKLLFRPLRLDTKAIKILTRMKDKSDSSIFQAIAEEIESAGIKLLDQRTYLGELLPSEGILTKCKPSKEQSKDIEYGMNLARKIAELGVGQTVVVKNQVPLAVEAIEGTDSAIRRGAGLCKGGAVVAKAVGQEHDFRFDVPTLGPDTIDVLAMSGAGAMAIEAGKAFVLDANQTIRKAEKAGIPLVVI